MIRATLHVGMVCQTIANSPVEEGKEKDLTREDVSCRIMYAANGREQQWSVCPGVSPFLSLFLSQ